MGFKGASSEGIIAEAAGAFCDLCHEAEGSGADRGKSPEVIFPDLRYGCVRCGKACQALHVTLAEGELEHLEALAATRERKQLHPLRLVGGRAELGRTARGDCLYLDPERTCAIHRLHGYEAKPRPCRAFPYLWQETPDGVYAGLSFLCTAVQRGQGPPLSEQADILEELVAGGPGLPPSLALTPARTLSWEEYRALEGHLAKALGQAPLEEHLWAGACAVAASAKRPGPLSPFPRAGWTSGFERRVHSFFLGLLSLAEADRITLPRVFEALQQGGSYLSSNLAAEVDVGQVAERWRDSPGTWFEPECRRYLDHLLFRKFLLSPGFMLGKILLLPFLSRLLRWLCWAGSLAGGKDGVREDYHRALDVVEGRLVTHARGVEPYLDQIAEAFLEEVMEA